MKKYEPGETVYVVNLYTGCGNEPTITENIVETVGRKYVYLEAGFFNRYMKPSKFPEASIDGCLQNAVDSDLYCFPSREQAEEWIEQKLNILWLRKNASCKKIADDIH